MRPGGLKARLGVGLVRGSFRFRFLEFLVSAPIHTLQVQLVRPGGVKARLGMG